MAGGGANGRRRVSWWSNCSQVRSAPSAAPAIGPERLRLPPDLLMWNRCGHWPEVSSTEFTTKDDFGPVADPGRRIRPGITRSRSLSALFIRRAPRSYCTSSTQRLVGNQSPGCRFGLVSLLLVAVSRSTDKAMWRAVLESPASVAAIALGATRRSADLPNRYPYSITAVPPAHRQ